MARVRSKNRKAISIYKARAQARKTHMNAKIIAMTRRTPMDVGKTLRDGPKRHKIRLASKPAPFSKEVYDQAYKRASGIKRSLSLGSEE